eukprot:547438-Rhodomonas_salina.2
MSGPDTAEEKRRRAPLDLIALLVQRRGQSDEVPHHQHLLLRARAVTRQRQRKTEGSMGRRQAGGCCMVSALRKKGGVGVGGADSQVVCYRPFRVVDLAFVPLLQRIRPTDEPILASPPRESNSARHAAVSFCRESHLGNTDGFFSARASREVKTSTMHANWQS